MYISWGTILIVESRESRDERRESRVERRESRDKRRELREPMRMFYIVLGSEGFIYLK